VERAETFAAALGLSLTQHQLTLLASCEELIAGKGISLGLVSRSDEGRIHERHILDSLRCAPELPEHGLCLDLGSGGGLPGLIVAIARPGLEVRLVERRERRAAFLELAVRTLGLENASVDVRDIADLGGTAAQAATARALAPLPQAWEMARPLLAPGGRLVYFAGEGSAVEDELKPGASSIEVVRSELLQGAGPLVIITR
jgi:16S rRNA (guanine527-N7)-methyltransferase